MSDLISGSIGSLYTNNTYDSSSTTGKLESVLTGSDLSGASEDELLSVCKDFEAYFVEQVFKAMEKMVPKDEDDDSSSSSNTLQDYYQDELIAQYANSASQANGGSGLGIAQMLYEQMKRNYNITE